jgi:glycosyltransferase involved in cell wall biosynthesis
MKIAMVTDQLGGSHRADDYPADPARRVLSLASALAGQGQQVTVYSRQDPAGRHPAVPCPGVTIEQVPAGSPESLEHLAALASQLADRWSCDPPDVIHAHFWTSGLAALAGARDLDIPVVQTFGSLGTGGGVRSARLPAGRSDAARSRLEAAIGRSAAAVMAHTADERAALARLGVPRASVRIVPCGVDITRFRPQGPVAERGRRPRLLMVSPPEDREGPAAALRALADVPRAELAIVSQPGDGRLSRLARTLGVCDRLTWLGRVSEAEMPPLMRSADVLVHLTPHPHFAMVAVEAMACGTPVVADEDAAPGDAVIHGNTGFLVPPSEPAQLARRIRQLLASPMLLEGYGIAAASRVRSRYSWARVGQETLAVYEAYRWSHGRSVTAPPAEAVA